MKVRVERWKDRREGRRVRRERRRVRRERCDSKKRGTGG